MENIIIGTNLVKEYEMNKNANLRIIKDINIEIKKGEFLAILGRSGSGKTTLINMLSGLISPTEGTIVVNNTDITHMNEKQKATFRNKEMGFVFQSFYVEKKFSAYDNVLFPLLVTKLTKTEMKDRVEHAMETVGLHNRMKHKPSEMSGGELQRLCIARAIVNEPDILFADEPTGQLDSVTAEHIMKLFMELKEAGKTIIMVTHSEKDASVYSNRIIRINDGKILNEVC